MHEKFLTRLDEGACILDFGCGSGRENLMKMYFIITDQVKEVDYLGMESGYDTDKLANIGFTVFEGGQTQHAPVIYDEEGHVYCGLGEQVGEAYKSGLVFK